MEEVREALFLPRPLLEGEVAVDASEKQSEKWALCWVFFFSTTIFFPLLNSTRVRSLRFCAAKFAKIAVSSSSEMPISF